MVLSNLKTLSQLTDDSLDCTAYKKYSSIVPKDLQPFQWEGDRHFFGSNNFRVFIDIDECLQNFQDTVRGARLDMDINYVRFLPLLVFGSMTMFKVLKMLFCVNLLELNFARQSRSNIDKLLDKNARMLL